MTLDSASHTPSEAPLQTVLWTLLGVTVASLAFELSVMLVPGVQENPHLLIRMVALVIVVQPGAVRLKSHLTWLIVLLGLSLAGFQLVHLAFTGAQAQQWACWLGMLLTATIAAWWLGQRHTEAQAREERVA